MVMVTVEVDVDIDDIVGELESRGFEVLDQTDPRLKAVIFEPDEVRVLIELIESQLLTIGSELYFIREKLVRA